MRSQARRGWGPRHIACAAALVVTLLGGCKDSGLPGINTPVAETMGHAWRYPLYEAANPTADRTSAVFGLGGARWIVTRDEANVPQRLLRHVATTQGLDVYALTWDEAPYTRLYVAEPGGAVRTLAAIH